jgi:ABC-type multidrug transport system ATPase subunit
VRSQHWSEDRQARKAQVAAMALEPPKGMSAGRDPLSSEILKEKIIAEKKKNKLILITSHILSDLDDLATDIIYLQEGKLRFFKNIETLRKETGEPKLGKAIAKIIFAGAVHKFFLSGDSIAVTKSAQDAIWLTPVYSHYCLTF